MAKKKRGVTIRGKNIKINRKQLRQYMRIMGSMGGFARAGVLTPETRSAIARYAAEVRYRKPKETYPLIPKPIAQAPENKRYGWASTGAYEQPQLDTRLKIDRPEDVLATRKEADKAQRAHVQRMLEDEARRRLET